MHSVLEERRPVVDEAIESLLPRTVEPSGLSRPSPPSTPTPVGAVETLVVPESGSFL